MTAVRRPGAGPSSRLSRKQILEAAHRHYVLGHTQAVIAEDLGISSGYIARLLQQAKNQGWVHIHVDIDPEVDLAARLRDRYPNLRHCEVVPTFGRPEETAQALGTSMANWLDDQLDHDRESEDPKIWNVAIGGGWVHQAMVERLVPRPNRVSVGPTALTPEDGQVARFTPSTLAAMLGMKWNALSPGWRLPPAEGRTGYRYNLTVDPPRRSLPALRDWFAALAEREGYRAMLGFWGRCDLVLVGMIGVDSAYHDVRKRLADLGLSIEAMKERGAVALVANQFVDAEGRMVPLADGVPSYEPSIPVDLLTRRVEGRQLVVEAWGEPSFGALSLLNARFGDVVWADSALAEKALAV